MKTEDLIHHLGRELRPVKALAPPSHRATVWLACAMGYVLFVACGSFIRRGALLGMTSDGPYVVQQLALIGTALLGARAAFRSVIPGASRGYVGAAVTGALVMLAVAWGIVRDASVQGLVGLGRETDWPCVVSISVGSAILWTLAATMLRRGAAFSPRMTGVLAGIAAISLANVEACVTRAHVYSVTVLLWHGITSTLVIALLALIGRHVLRWSPT